MQKRITCVLHLLCSSVTEDGLLKFLYSHHIKVLYCTVSLFTWTVVWLTYTLTQALTALCTNNATWMAHTVRKRSGWKLFQQQYSSTCSWIVHIFLHRLGYVPASGSSFKPKQHCTSINVFLSTNSLRLLQVVIKTTWCSRVDGNIATMYIYGHAKGNVAKNNSHYLILLSKFSLYCLLDMFVFSYNTLQIIISILVSERRWSAHQCRQALEWLKSPILEWQSLLQLVQM